MQLISVASIPPVIHDSAASEHRYIGRLAQAALAQPALDESNVQDVLAALAVDVRGVQMSFTSFEEAFGRRTANHPVLTDAWRAGSSASSMASKISMLNLGASMVERLPAGERAEALQQVLADATATVPMYARALVAARDAYAAVMALPVAPA